MTIPDTGSERITVSDREDRPGRQPARIGLVKSYSVLRSCQRADLIRTYTHIRFRDPTQSRIVIVHRFGRELGVAFGHPVTQCENRLAIDGSSTELEKQQRHDGVVDQDARTPAERHGGGIEAEDEYNASGRGQIRPREAKPQVED